MPAAMTRLAKWMHLMVQCVLEVAICTKEWEVVYQRWMDDQSRQSTSSIWFGRERRIVSSRWEETGVLISSSDSEMKRVETTWVLN